MAEYEESYIYGICRRYGERAVLSFSAQGFFVGHKRIS